jgi:putative endonuclease
MDAATAREKQLKAWKRDWKIALIEEHNPLWEDRAVEFGFEPLGNPSKGRVHGS